ncbi:hypothetical protein [Actinomyces vulturis]|uniref:hypothetical protein n=1 Tax=Actinomyces vulturis TaxID=1857645 RepID=UPI00082D4911|nr:hypothetical protein [Actinomyces vulturis]
MSHTLTSTSAPSLPAKRRKRPSIATGIRLQFLTDIKDPSFVFFAIIMPVAMYQIFGTNASWAAEVVNDKTNVSATILVAMATFSAAISAASAAASTAADLSSGWARQVALTAGGVSSYLTSRLVSALLMAIIPVTILYIMGAAQIAWMSSLGLWAVTYVLSITAGIPFALFGLAVGMWAPARSAPGIAGSATSLLAFLGNAFMPLGGSLFTFARFTPMYGVLNLARRPMMDDAIPTADGVIHEPLWIPTVNALVWIAIFLIIVVLGFRRTTQRYRA